MPARAFLPRWSSRSTTAWDASPCAAPSRSCRARGISTASRGGARLCARPSSNARFVQKGDVQSFSEGCAANDMVAGCTSGVAHGGCGDARGRGVFWGGTRLRAHRGRARAHGRRRARHAREQRLCAGRPSLSADACRQGPHRTIPSLRSLPSIRAARRSSPTPVRWRLRLPMLRRPRCWRCRSASRSSIWRHTLPMPDGRPSAARTPKDRGLALRVRHLTSTDRTT